MVLKDSAFLNYSIQCINFEINLKAVLDTKRIEIMWFTYLKSYFSIADRNMTYIDIVTSGIPGKKIWLGFNLSQ